jgi:putative methionine-R-sulfoxide reductase with GAF domain
MRQRDTRWRTRATDRGRSELPRKPYALPLQLGSRTADERSKLSAQMKIRGAFSEFLSRAGWAHRAAGPTGSRELETTPERTRRLEHALILVRWFGVVLGAFLVTQSSGPGAPSRHGSVIAVGEVIIAILALGNVGLMLALPRATSTLKMQRLGLAAFVLDTAVIFALIWNASYTPLDAAWALLVVLPLEGAIRYGMRGALASVGVAFINEMAREAYLAHRFIGGFSVGNVAFRIGLDAIVALVAGSMAADSSREEQNAREQATKYQEAAERETQARRQLAAFNSVILAGLLAEGLDQALVLMARAIGKHLEYDALAIMVRDGEELVTKASWGVSSRIPGDRIPLGQGVAGTVALTGDLLLVPDVRVFSNQVVSNPVIRAEMAAPVQSDEECVGVIDVESRHENAFDGESLLLLKRLAEHIALVMQNEHLKSQERRILARLSESSDA